MKIITRKPEIKALVEQVFADARTIDESALVFKELILTEKVRFPLLEYASELTFREIPEDRQLQFLDRISAFKTIGGNVILGKMLQLRWNESPEQSFEKATEYIIAGNEWYVCDIIGERVFGHALLTNPELTLPVLRACKHHEDKWMVRTIGVATHYAVKNGLKKQPVADVFELLLSCADTTDFHTKKGIGWGAKTIAKFHPGIVFSHQEQLETDATIQQWFKTKIQIGLGRTGKYAGKYTD